MILSTYNHGLIDDSSITAHFSSEVVWDGIRDVETSNIPHVEDIEMSCGFTIEDMRKQAFDIQIKTSGGISNAWIEFCIIMTDGKWYLMWMQ